MAVAATALTGAIDGIDRTSYTTASVTPTANRLIFCLVQSRAAGSVAPTLTGCGLTWVQVVTGTNAAGSVRLTLFRAMGAAPTTGTLDIDFAGQAQSNCSWSVVEFDGVDTSGTNGSGAVVQAPAVVETSSSTSASVTLAAFSNAANATYGAFTHLANEGSTPGSGFTELHDVFGGGPNQGTITEWRADNDTSVDASWASAVTSLGLAVEIAAAPVGGAATQIIVIGSGGL